MIDFPESLGFTQTMTPIQKLNDHGKYQVWIKRDDMTGIELSGNKIRKLDFLVHQAIEEGAHGFMTCGGLQSNHCRAAAYLGAKLGMETILFLRGKPEESPTGNYFLNLLAGATIHYVSPEEYQQINKIMQNKAKDYETQGKNIYVIPEGGSNEIGAWGYCKCFSEITEQIKTQNIQLDAVAVATGSGGTHAGLLIGKILSKSDLEIISINVCDDAEFFRNKIYTIISNFKKRYRKSFDIKKEDILIYDGYVGEGYGIIGEEEVNVIKRFVRDEGIILDPVYTAKAYLGLEQLMEHDRMKYRNILFIHTGGVFGIFPLAMQFL
jgi:D-cysteine desulfhydrase